MDESIGTLLIPFDFSEGGLSGSRSSLFDLVFDTGANWSGLPGDLLRCKIFLDGFEFLVGGGFGLGF